MPDICAAIGLAQIRKYKDVLLVERERVARQYQEFFSKHLFFQLPLLEDDERKSCFHLYALRLNNCTEQQRDLIIEEITQRGVAVNVHFVPMPMLTLFKNLGYKIEDYPVAYDNYSREISLPIYPQLTNEQVEYICEAVLTSYRKVITVND
jgi:dTDP-4-amino-4,6-dideoxygalactose transaminase